MSTILAPAGLVPLQAPLPSRRPFELVDAAALVDPPNSRWLGGAWIGGDAPGPAYTHDPCSTGSDRIKADAGPIPRQMVGVFDVYLVGFCTAQSVGPDPDFFTERLRLAFQIYESAAVERVFATGDGHGTLGPYLGDANMETLGVGAQQPLRALELLETEIAETSGSGMIHAAPATATAWAAQLLIESVRGVMRTRLGTPVAVGSGYVGAVPDGEAAPAADEEWAFASGPVELLRAAEIQSVPSNYSEALDRSLNDVQFLAERPYLINWIARQDTLDDDHAQAGVLVDLTP